MGRSFGEIVEDDINITTLKNGEIAGTDHSIDVDYLENLIKEELQAQVHPPLSSDFCLCRVPIKIREINAKAYEPRIVSIGPFYHGDVRYKSMEYFKKRTLEKLLKRNREVPLKNYIKFLKDNETLARQSYSEILEVGSDEFVRMLLLDSCFILELMLCYFERDSTDVDIRTLLSARFCRDLELDLILFENQIPFFVLEGLYSLAMTGFQSIPDLLYIAIEIFGNYNQQNKSLGRHINSVRHFTDLILVFHRPMDPNKAAAYFFQKPRTVTELDDAGIKFKVSKSKCLLDITFRDGILEIPFIPFGDSTECAIRNMMALELCCYFKNSYMIDYVMFLDYLIDTPKDVDLLLQSGTIYSWLGDSKQVADIINNMTLYMNVDADNFKLSCLSAELDDYCKTPIHKWRATLRRDYFTSPYAVVLLVLTLIQTLFSVLSAFSAFRGQ